MRAPVCPQFPGNALVHRPALLEYIGSDRIAGNAQLDGALEYLGALGAQPLDVAAFERAAGVGVVVRTSPCQQTMLPRGCSSSALPRQHDAKHSGYAQIGTCACALGGRCLRVCRSPH